MIVQERERLGRSARDRGAFLFGQGGGPAGGSADGSDTPGFSVFLQNTLVPTINAMGQGTPTFTRATTAYQTDFEGKLNAVLSGEARFQGARRVRNLHSSSSSEVFNTWSKTGAAATPTANVLNTPSAGSYISTFANVPAVANRTFRATWMLSGSGTLEIALGNNTDQSTQNVITLSATLTRYSVLYAANSTVSSTLGYLIGRVTGTPTATSVTIINFIVEDVTGQTNQNPSEYVSVGVLSAPYPQVMLDGTISACGVDGVGYAKYLNPNTVSSNVVTQGATLFPIVAGQAGVSATAPVDAGGPFGYLSEGLRQNLALQSQTFNVAPWTTFAIGIATTDNQYVAPDGTTTAAKLTASAGNTQHRASQGSLTLSAVPYVFSAYLRYVNNRWASLVLYDGTTFNGASFDLLNGVVGLTTLGVTSIITPTAIAGVYRVSLTVTTLATAAGQVYVSLNATSTASNETWNAAGTEIIGVWGAQLEAASFASTYIPTTTVAVTRNADVLTYPSAGNASGTETIYSEFVPTLLSSGSFQIVMQVDDGSDTNRNIIALDSGTTKAYGQTVVTASQAQILSGVNTAGALIKAVYSSDTNNFNAAFNGTLGTPDVSGSIPSGLTTIRIGKSFGAGADYYGTQRNLRIYPKALPTSKLTAMTTP